MSFSADESTVRIQTSGGSIYDFVRPVTPSWSYEPKGATMWVDTSGSDTNPGTSDLPFATIGKAVSLAMLGDLMYVRAGTYVEAVQFPRSGEADRPIILSCAPGALGRVKVTPPASFVSANVHGAAVTLASYVWVNGLVVEGPRGRPEAPTEEHYGSNGITLAPYDQVTNCIVYNNIHCGMKTISLDDSHGVMRGNVIFGNGTASTDHGIYSRANYLTIDGNIIFDNTGFGIHTYPDPTGQVITRNITFRNAYAGIIVSSSGNTVRYNTSVSNLIGFLYFRGGCTMNAVDHNIFAMNDYDCGWDNGGGNPEYGSPASNVDDYNDYFPGVPDSRISPGVNEIHVDPLLKDPAHGDFRPTAPECVGVGAFAQ